MKHKKLIIVSSVVAGLIVLMGLVGGSVLAASSTTSTTSTSPDSAFAAKVATILGVDQAKVEAAFTQARKEMRTEAEDSRLAKMIEDGTITQAQADQYKAWLESKPDVPAVLDGPGGRGGMMGPGFGGHGPRQDSSSTTDSTTSTN
jgi:hypothetical protein